MPGEAFRAIAGASTMPTFAYFNNFAPLNVAGSVEALVVVVEVDVVVFFSWALAEMAGSDRHSARAVRQTRRVFMLLDLSYSKISFQKPFGPEFIRIRVRHPRGDGQVDTADHYVQASCKRNTARSRRIRGSRSRQW